MKKTNMFGCALVVLALVFAACPTGGGGGGGGGGGEFVAVTNITGVQTAATAGTALTLSGTVAPANATNKTITWTVKTAGATGAAISGNTLTTTAAGTATITATIANGATETTPFTKNFTITVALPGSFVAVTDITSLPTSATAGTALTLSGTVAPANATSQTITWTVKTAGTTGAAISGNTLTTTAAGTVEITAAIANGATETTPFTKNFTITVALPAAGMQSVRTISGVAVPFRYVPAGKFQRDGTAANVSVITKGYWMAETETTQELFEAVMGSNPSGFSSDPASGETQTKRPVEYLNWYAAIAFCNKLSLANGKQAVYSVQVGGDEIDWTNLAYAQIPTERNPDWDEVTMDTGKNGYRLPTEMEWMWAAMGADKTSQPNTTGRLKAFAGSNGSNSIGDYAWYGPNSGRKTHEVGKKAANELGLSDMSGNVFEWCWDGAGDYPNGEQTDFTGAVSGSRVMRGGSWNRDADCTVAVRIGPSSATRNGDLGFRFVCP